MNARLLIAAAVLPIALTACPKDKEERGLTAGQALQAVEEASIASQAESLTSNSIEIATNFTIGQAVEAAADELRSFIVTQLPCAEISLSGHTLSVEYGAKAGNCSYRGQTFKGTHEVSVDKNEMGEVLVHHNWSDFSNGRVSVTGSADVTWNLSDKTRHVVHNATWTRLSDGRQGVGAGDRTQGVLEGGLVEGIQVDGSRSWQGNSGHWDLVIDGVQMRWVDPVPQSGSYTLVTPFEGREAKLSFARKDADTITVTVSSGKAKFSFDVSKLGTVSEDG